MSSTVVIPRGMPIDSLEAKMKRQQRRRINKENPALINPRITSRQLALRQLQGVAQEPTTVVSNRRASDPRWVGAQMPPTVVSRQHFDTTVVAGHSLPHRVGGSATLRSALDYATYRAPSDRPHGEPGQICSSALCEFLLPIGGWQISNLATLSDNTVIGTWHAENFQRFLHRLTAVAALHSCQIVDKSGMVVLRGPGSVEYGDYERSNLLMSAQALADAIGGKLIAAHFESEVGHSSFQSIDGVYVYAECNDTKANDVVALGRLMKLLIKP